MVTFGETDNWVITHQSAGDRYFVCWDPDIVPPTVVQVSSIRTTQAKCSNLPQSYNYPPNKERIKKDITRKDLATHFAMYNK